MAPLPPTPVLAIGYESRDVVRWMNERGVTAFVLRYRVGLETREASRKGRRRGLLAVKTVRRRAAEWKLDSRRIGVLGFSAGGYLTVGAATAYEPESRPYFAVPIYAAMPEYRVRTDAPPLFIAIAADDTAEGRSSPREGLQPIHVPDGEPVRYHRAGAPGPG